MVSRSCRGDPYVGIFTNVQFNWSIDTPIEVKFRPVPLLNESMRGRVSFSSSLFQRYILCSRPLTYAYIDRGMDIHAGSWPADALVTNTVAGELQATFLNSLSHVHLVSLVYMSHIYVQPWLLTFNQWHASAGPLTISLCQNVSKILTSTEHRFCWRVYPRFQPLSPS